MNDTPQPTPLTDQALARLRKLAAGNGLDPNSIQLVGTEENTYEMEGVLTLTPKTEIQQGRYQGAPKGRDRQIVPDLGTLKSEIEQRRQQFMQGRDWVEKALGELKAAEGHGWGLEGAHVTMPDRDVILAASVPCPVCLGQKLVTCQQCRGQGLIICGYCQGNRQEPCYTCGGTGYNPQDRNQPCLMCQGRRFVTCRYCQGRGQQTCPACHGNRGTPCHNCKGAGQLTEEAAITFSAETHFKLNSQGLPSGLRRGLDRLGIANLAKGYADIEIVKAKTEEEPPRRIPDDEKPAPKTPPELHYLAKVPYADIRVRLGGNERAVMISAFGKRGSLLGVPPFLDNALQTARNSLQQARTNGAVFEDALKARAIREALEIELAGKSIKEFRKLYPIGISQEAAQEIMFSLQQAMKAFTLRMRTIGAVASGVLSAGLLALVFMTSLHATATQGLPEAVVFLLDMAFVMAVIGLDIFVLNAASRMALQRRFPDLHIALKLRMSKTAYALAGVMVVIYAVILFMAPTKPVWLLRFFGN